MISKIQNWVNDEYEGRVKVTRDEDYDPERQPFLLKMTFSNILGTELPVSIFKPKQYKNKIAVYSAIRFNDEEQKSFHGLNSQSKERIMTELYNNLAIMGFLPNFIPEENFNQIAFQDKIYFDGISQDRILNSLEKIIIAYSYIINVLIAYKILRSSFDASKST